MVDSLDGRGAGGGRRVTVRCPRTDHGHKKYIKYAEKKREQNNYSLITTSAYLNFLLF